MNTVRVTCHCGAIELSVRLSDGLNTARRCDCSYCARRGAIMISAPAEGVELVRGADTLGTYQWNTQVAEHHFCRVCGIYTHHRRRSNPDEYGINAGCIEGVNPRDLGEVPWVEGRKRPLED
ncbi:GFA family protein [Tranquillimonas rosea]|uniref:GFA family protein n=1 Tax=Tranquillimonas rosea TaxID=641238 RepID=UPI003BACBFEE